MTTPYMSLPVASVASTQSPDWAYDINASFSIVDQHNHSTGQGQQVQPNGLNINSDLTFQSNNAYALRSARFTSQSAVLGLSTDVGCLYVVGNELYYNDYTGGHNVQITTNGSVNSGAGSITGLPSGTASASYASGTFVWQSATNTAANMDGQSFIFRNSSASSKGLTLQAPAAMAANYSLTLPSLPAAQSFLTCDVSGNIAGYANIAAGITGSNIAAATVTKANQVAVGQQISSSCGAFTTASSSLTDVTNLTVTITTSGRPVMLMLNAVAGVASAGSMNVRNSSTGTAVTANATVAFLRAGTVINQQVWGGVASSTVSPYNTTVPSSSFLYLDTPAAGTYTYKVQAKILVGTTLEIDNTTLVAYEL